MKSVLKLKLPLAALACVLIAGRSFAQDTTMLSGTVTLDQCIAIAIKNNLQVNESGFTSANSRVSLQQAFGNFLPNISLNIGHNLSEGRVINSVNNTYVTQSSTSAGYNLNLGETVWNAGAIRNYYSGNRLAYEASKMDLQTQKDNISISVILAYLQVLSNEEQLGQAIQQVESYNQQLSVSRAKDSLGALSNPADFAVLKGQLATSELQVINLKKAVESSKISLLQFLNLPYSNSFELQKIDDSVTPVPYDVTADIIFQQALQNLAFIKSGYLKTQSAQKLLKSARGQMWPSISFGANAGSNFSSLATDQSGKIPYPTQLGNNFGSSFSLNLNVPILNYFSLKSSKDRAKISLARASFEEKTNRTVLQQNVQQAYINVNSGYAAYQKNIEQVSDFTEAARVAQVRFNEGVTTSADYIIAKTSADQAQLNLIATKYDYILRTKVLDYYQGKLTFK